MSAGRPLLAVVAVITLAYAVAVALAAERKRTYHVIEIADFATAHVTHVETAGCITYQKKEADGDRHLRLEPGWPPSDEAPFIIAEITPSTPVALTRPLRVGDCVTIRGIRRYDDENAPGHEHWEVHPVEWITIHQP